MTLARFDRLAGLAIVFAIGLSTGVALADWTWFPTDDWGDIARIPPTWLNYVALLLPPVLILLILVARRKIAGAGR